MAKQNPMQTDRVMGPKHPAARQFDMHSPAVTGPAEAPSMRNAIIV